MTELKPCPFCGGEPYLAKRVLQYDADSDPVTWYGYGCKLCKVQFGCYNDTIEQAREQWNRRFLSESDVLAIVNGWLDCERYACDNSEDEQEACHTVLSIVMKRQEGKE